MPHIAIEESSPEEQLLRRERFRELYSALAALPEREQEIIALKFAGRLTNRQIAAVLNLSETNVGTTLYRAMHKLRERLTAPKRGNNA